MKRKINNYLLSILSLLIIGCTTSKKEMGIFDVDYKYYNEVGKKMYKRHFKKKCKFDPKRLFKYELPGDAVKLFYTPRTKDFESKGRSYGQPFIDFLPLGIPEYKTSATEHIIEPTYPQLKDVFEVVYTLPYMSCHAVISHEDYFKSITRGTIMAKSLHSANGFLSMNAYVSIYLHEKYILPDSIIFYVNGKYVRGKEVDKLIGLKKQDLKGFSLDFDSISKTLNVFVRTKEK